MLRKVKLEQAIGLAIGHDMTRVIPGQFKGPAFRRGHVVTEADLPQLRQMGKEHIYVIEEEEGLVHEEEAALRIATAACGDNLKFSRPKEGRVNMIATVHGLLKINQELLKEINSLGDIVLATQHSYTVCRPETIVAATKITPLLIAEAKLQKVEELCRQKGKVVQLIPFTRKKVGIIITGNEVFNGLVEDKFGDTLRNKVEALGSVVEQQAVVPDDEDVIGQAAKDMAAQGVEVILIAGGLSVDPDDVTVEGVAKSGAEIISYGAPVMPGAMFLYAELNGIPILGAPGAVIFNQATIIDLMLPRVLAGEKISREDIVELGHGGLCLNCADGCTFPVCPFGK